MCLLMSCTKPTSPDEGDFPQLDGIFAYTAISESGYSDLYVKNQVSTINLSATWKISSPGYPTFSKDGKTLFFHGKENGRWGIYSYDIQSGAIPTCLTAEIKVDCTQPYCENDLLVFNKGGQVSSFDLSTGKVSALTFGKSTQSPSLSPDEKTIAYIDISDGANSIVKLNTASLSSSSTEMKGCARPLITNDGVIIYEKTGKGIGVDNSLVFPAGTFPTPVSDEFIIFSDGTSLRLGNLSSGKDKTVFEGSFSQCTYRQAQVNIAEPENGGKEPSTGDIIDSDTKRPTLGGKMVYHNYTSYDAMDSRMYIYDFALDEITEISRGWTVVNHPMNGHFSPDGKYITLMGIGAKTGSWDIFLYELGSSSQPVNLTPEGAYRDEDPKFSYDGTKICFKRNDHLAEIDVQTKKITILSNNDSSVDPYSMPYYTVDDEKLLFSGGHDPNSYIALWDIKARTVTKLYDKPGTVEYYPITIDKESFYYSQHVSPTDNHDQLYKGFFDGRTSICLAFNKKNADYSDACPVSNEWLILVSTRSDSKGGYDLYIANETSGAIYPLSDYNSSINTSKNELGPDYIPAAR